MNDPRKQIVSSDSKRVEQVSLRDVSSRLGWPKEKQKEKVEKTKMGFADSVGGGTPPGSYSNFEIGRYLAQLTGYNTKDTEDRGEAFIATFDVLRAKEGSGNKVGAEDVDWYQGTDQFPKTAPGAVRGMFAAVSGSDIEEIDAENVKIIMGSNKPLVGRLVSVIAKQHTTRVNKKEIVVCNFEAVDMSDEDMAATAKRLRVECGLEPLGTPKKEADATPVVYDDDVPF